MAACPNINSEEWKNLVTKVGSEFQAYALFFNNDYTIPNENIKPLSVTTAEARDINSLKKFTEIKTDILFSLNKKIAEYKHSKNQEAVTALRSLAKDLQEADINESVSIMINNGLSLVESLTKKVEKIAADPTKLKQTSDYLGVFNDLKEISGFIKSSELILDKDAVVPNLNKLLGLIDTFNEEYVEYGKEQAVKFLSPESTFIRDKQRMQLDLEFVKQNPRSKFNGTSEEYQANKKEFIDNQMALMEEELTVRTEDYVRDQLNTSQQDIGTIAAWIDDPRGTNDHIIQLVTQMLDKADYNAMTYYNSSRQEILSALKEYENSVGKFDNQKKKYEGIIEKVNGKETNYIVGIMYNAAMEDYKTFKFRQIDPAIDNATKEKERKEFREKYIKEEFHTKSLTDKQVNNDMSHPMVLYAKDEFRNPQWDELQQNSAKLKMWNAIREYNRSSDRIAKRGYLNYKLPSIKKHEFETLAEDGLLQYTKQSIKDATTKNTNDIELGATETIDGVTKVLTDNKGNIVKRVNLPFRNDIPITEQSFDLVGMALANRYASLNYREKNNIKADIEIVKDVIAERAVISTKNDNKLISTVKNASKEILGISEEEVREVTTLGASSNSFKLLSSIIEDRLYGVGIADTTEIFGKDLDKVTGTLMKWSSNTFLIGNYLGATSNVLQGKVMNLLEGVKGNHFDRKNLRNAEGIYFKDIQNVLSDVGEIVPTSKTNLLMEKLLNTSVGFDSLTADIVKNNKFKRLANVRTLHGLNTTAEHYIQGTLMYAVLDNIEVDGKKLHELYSVKDGELVLDADIDESVLSRKVKGITASLQGNYDPNNKAMAQRYWYGKLAFFLRKWIVRGVKRRWMGINTTDKSIEELLEKDPHLIHYSQETGEFQEGTYTSVVRFLRDSTDAIKSLKLQVLSSNWQELTDMEKQNIRSAVVEMSLLVGALASAMLLQGLAEDDDNDYLYNYAYMTRRLYGELMFYVPVNPSEAIRILRTPSATITTLESLSKTIGQIGEDMFINHGFEKYEQGKNKGKVKSLHMFRRTFDPFYKNIIDREAEESLKFLTNL